MPREIRDLLELLASRFESINYSLYRNDSSSFFLNNPVSTRALVETLHVNVCRVCLVPLELLVRLERPETE